MSQSRRKAFKQRNRGESHRGEDRSQARTVPRNSLVLAQYSVDPDQSDAMGRHRKLEAMQQPLRRENFWFMLSVGWLAFLLVVTACVLGF